MTTQEVADKLVSYCRQGQFDEAIATLYADDVISIEPDGAPNKEVRGLDAVKQKTAHFNSMVEEVHGSEISDPIVADKFFTCSIKMELTFKGAPKSSIEEICLYKVENGKIVFEEFFYTPMPQG
ncbi:MAG: nuclear transport factor 2 family protein [Saonia sp.]